jgi:gliding motility-associated lipoprotein GldD
MKLITYLIILSSLVSCTNETFVPKPPTYLRTELPDHKYTTFSDNCDYSFDISDIFKVEKMANGSIETCNKKIDLGPLNGTMYMRYWDMTEPLSYYVNNANDEVDKHKLKATNIIDKRIIRGEDRVFGTYFKLEGDVATPFQFYLTDSTSKFIYCEILFNSTPNYDSLIPSLDYLSIDIDKMLSSFKWKK